MLCPAAARCKERGKSPKRAGKNDLHLTTFSLGLEEALISGVVETLLDHMHVDGAAGAVVLVLDLAEQSLVVPAQRLAHRREQVAERLLCCRAGGALGGDAAAEEGAVKELAAMLVVQAVVDGDLEVERLGDLDLWEVRKGKNYDLEGIWAIGKARLGEGGAVAYDLGQQDGCVGWESC